MKMLKHPTKATQKEIWTMYKLGISFSALMPLLADWVTGKATGM